MFVPVGGWVVDVRVLVGGFIVGGFVVVVGPVPWRHYTVDNP